MSKNSSSPGRGRGLSGSARRRKLRGAVQPRRLSLETLETRALLTYTYPFGATVDDTGEYMLGDIVVNVVLMESESSVWPHDDGSFQQFDPYSGTLTPVNYTPENWTQTEITGVKNKVIAAMQWWKETYFKEFPNAPADSLTFDIDFTYANTPVNTGYEPIARISDDILGDSTASGPGKGWLYDFLRAASVDKGVTFDETGVYYSDMRAFNDFTRREVNADWAFTIFVVDNSSDPDKFFGAGGSYSQAYSFPGGQFMVVPASRPVITFAHETGHQFWALDQYTGGASYTEYRGYYNTQNFNSEEGRPTSFVQQPTIMSTDHLNRNPPTFAQSTSYNQHDLDPYTMASIGWKDSDRDGIMDVLDVPFTLSGTGWYDPTGHFYSFRGAAHVNTMPNANPVGPQHDITINQLRKFQYQIDNGPWIDAITYPDRTYTDNISLDVPLSIGSTIQFRALDTRNGITSNVFIGTTDTPTNETLPGLEGAIFLDQNGNTKWDYGEPLQAGVEISIADQNGQPLALQHKIEPDNYVANWILNNVDASATLRAVGLNAGTGDVVARPFAGIPSAGQVLTATDYPSDSLPTWNPTRHLRVDFNSYVSTVSIRAYGASATTASFARMDAYNVSGQIVARFDSGELTSSSSKVLTVSRAQADILYVIVYGWQDTEVILDSLTWGPSNSTTSNSDGAYSLSTLPDGTYRLQFTPISGYHVSNPTSGTAIVVVSGGATTSNVNFGIAPDSIPTYKFHNYGDRFNVNPHHDNQITALDVLLIINYINANPGIDGRIAMTKDPNIIGYLDVVADGVCAADDALAIINYINAHPGEEAAPDSSADTAYVATANSTDTNSTSSTAYAAAGLEPEGEYTVPTPQSPAEYFASPPVFSRNIRGGDKPCNCSACFATRGQAVAEFSESLQKLGVANSDGSADGASGLDTTLELIATDVSRVKLT